MDKLKLLKKTVNKVNTINKSLGGISLLEGDSEDSPTIKVCVRVRPFIKEEIEGDRCGGRIECCIAMPTITTCEMLGREETRRFDFDRCYWSHSEDHPLYANQQTLQDELGQSMIESAMNGFNNCIFAYGQTGSGKSFSVLGGKGDARGLLPRVVEGLFEHFAQLDESVQWKTEVSFIEIYNDQIRDLFAVREEGQKEKNLEVRQHAVLGTVIPGLTEAPVKSCEEVMKLVEYGTTMRQVAETAMNATSSRSHCIFTFKTSVSESEGQAKMSGTNLVDLAGSERAGRTKASGQRLKEGAAINQSLSVLATVIRELAKQSMRKKSNPPFRQSKLTYILKESLCGNSKTVMMAAISPALADYDETLSTMNFAKSVKQVQTKAVVNQVNEKGVEEALRAELEELRAKMQLMEQRKSLGGPLDVSTARQSEHIQKRLKEQEQLCKWFGKDWEDIVAEEKSRQQKRTAILQHDVSSLEELRKAHSRQETEEGDEDAATRSDAAAETPSDSDEDSDDNNLQAPLVNLQKPKLQEEARKSLRVGTPSSIAIIGPRAASCKVSDRLLSARSTALARVRGEAVMVEEAVTKLSAKTLPRLRVRVLVGIEPVEVGEQMALEVLIHADRASTAIQEPADAGAGGTESGEWISEDTLRKRLEWLRAATSEEVCFDQADYGGDAWRAATAATASKPDLGGSPARSEREPEEDSASVVSMRSAVKEVDRMHEELHMAQDELSRTKSKLKKEKESAKDLRTELEDTQEELAKAKANLKAQRDLEDGESRTAEELAQVRAELKAAREQVAEERERRLQEQSQLRAKLEDAQEGQEDAVGERERWKKERAELRAELESLKEQMARREREHRASPPQASAEILKEHGIAVDALGQVKMQAADIAKAVALSFDNAIQAIDMAQLELERINE